MGIRVIECDQHQKQLTHLSPAFINSADDPAFEEMYQLLTDTFEAGEVEPFESLQREIAESQSGTRFICVILNDLSNANQIAGVSYASFCNGILAIRFGVTSISYRGTGVSQNILRLTLDEAQRMGDKVKTLFGECVARSETFWNRAFDPPMRRVYQSSKSGLEELHYELPHLGQWNPDGTPIDVEPESIKEHLQISDLSFPTQISDVRMKEILNSVWKSWYVKPRHDFESETAWMFHYESVMVEILERRILHQMNSGEELVLLTRDERLQYENRGITITELELD